MSGWRISNVEKGKMRITSKLSEDMLPVQKKSHTYVFIVTLKLAGPKYRKTKHRRYLEVKKS